MMPLKQAEKASPAGHYSLLHKASHTRRIDTFLRSIHYSKVQNNQQFRRELITCLGLFCFAMLWFGTIEWMYPKYFIWDDNATYYGPMFIFNQRAFHEAYILPLIDFFQFAGWNHLGAGQAGILYPPAYIAAWAASTLFQNPLLTVDLLAILHLTCGMFALYAWLKILGANRYFAQAGAMFYLTLPFTTILSRAWIVVSYIHFFAPLCLLLLEKYIRAPSPKKFIAYTIAKTLFLYAGYPQYFAYLTVIELLYILLYKKESARTQLLNVTRYAVANTLVIVLSLPLLLPMAEATLLSTQRAEAFSLGMAISGMIDFVHVLAAQLFIFYELPIVNLNTMFHIGGSIFVPWIALKILFAKSPLPAHIRSMIILSVIALLLSSPYHVFLSILPVFSHFRWPFKMYFFFSLFYTIALFLTLQWMYQQKMIHKITVSIILAYAMLCHFMLVPFPPRAAFRISHLESPLPQTTQGNFRSLGVRSDTDSSMNPQLPSFNLGTLWGVPTLAGYYDPLLSRVHAGIIGEIGRSGLVNPTKITESIARYSDWSVRYFITSTPLDQNIIKLTDLSLLQSASGQFIYENKKAFPIASFESAPDVPVDITYGTNRVSLHTKDRTGLLRLRLAPIEGYIFTDANGKRHTPILTESGLLLSIVTPQEIVNVTYRSRAFDTGILLTLAGSTLFAAISLLKLARRKNRRP